MKTNYHNHCFMDDGSGELKEHAEAALAAGISSLGFTCHAPLPFTNEWTLTDENLPVYLKSVRHIREEYKDKLDIYAGLEVDYIPGQMGPSSTRIKKLNLDYTIGSVHMLEDPSDGQYYGIDGPDSEFLFLLNNVFRGDIKKMVKAYFQAEIELIREHDFDILGHCDLMKKKNKGNRYFNQDEGWYKEEALAMLDVLAGKGIIMEVNTGAIARGYQTEFYPSPWMLANAFKLGIPITLNSDCHDPRKIDEAFSESLSIIKGTGYKELQILKNGKWRGELI